jgi:CHU_C Type IX secretion signal domain/SprB repeat
MLRNLYLLFLLAYIPVHLLGQTLSPGDIAVLGVNANTFACGGPSGGDEISFVCFKDIETGATIDITDNGWERCNAGQWGDSEGFIRFTRIGSTIAAGTVITYKHLSTGSFGTYDFASPDNEWSVSNLNTVNSIATSVNMNAGGDQLFFMSGGIWSNLETIISNDATYDGNILFGFNTKSTWQANCSSSPTQNSNLHPDIETCFHMEPTGAKDFAKYTGLLTAADRLTWIGRIRNQANWSFFTNCNDYNTTFPIYPDGLQLSILPTQIGVTSSGNGVCPGDTAFLQLLLPANGGPFGVTWTDFTTETTFNGAVNTEPIPILPTASHVYTITALTDVNGCTIYGNYSSFYLEVFPKDTIRFLETTCIPSEAGINIQRLNNRFGCDSTVIEEILFDSLACSIVISAQANNVSCFGYNDGEIVIKVIQGKAPITYQWQQLNGNLMGNGVISTLNQVDTLQNLRSGAYKITLTDANGVQTIKDTLITQPDGMMGQIGVLSDFNGYAVRCANDANGRVAAAVAGGTPAYIFEWSNGENQAIADSLSVGLQSLTITDAEGCTVQFSVTLDAPPPLEVDITVKGELCYGKNNGSILIENTNGGVAPYQIFFDNNNVEADTLLENLAPGNYQIRFIDDNDCFLEYAAILPEGPSFDIEIGQDTTIFTGDSIVLAIESMQLLDTLLFSPNFAAQIASNEALFFPPNGYLYQITAIDENGCYARDSIFIGVKKKREVYAPNVFAPDSKNFENQFFTLYTDKGVIEIKEFQIFDRFGALVFQKETLLPNQPQEGWDGLIGKRKAAAGVYVWSGFLIYTDGRGRLEKGGVLLIR